MSKQTSDLSKKKNLPQKTVSWREMNAQHTFSPYASEAFLEKLADELIDEITKDETVISLEKQLLKRQIMYVTFMRWREKSEALNTAAEYVLSILATRREELALYGKINTGVFMYIQPHYSKHWKDIAEWRASLKNDQTTNKGQITIIKECYNSDHKSCTHQSHEIQTEKK